MIPAVFSPHAVRGHFPALTQTIGGQPVAFLTGQGGASTAICTGCHGDLSGAL